MFAKRIIRFDSGRTSSGMMTWYCAVLECGHNWYDDKRAYEPIQGVSANVGDLKDCKVCEQHAQAVERLRALDPAKERIMYFRYNPRFTGSYNAYRRDETSPTGVMLHSSYPAIKEIDDLISEKRICALSPTEGRER